jgi:hypothetical protein
VGDGAVFGHEGVVLLVVVGDAGWERRDVPVDVGLPCMLPSDMRWGRPG